MEILGYDLVCTCGSCPEQYNVYRNGKQVAYLRLRWGEFRARVPDDGGAIVYEAEPDGNGRFEDGERLHFLTEAIQAIIAHSAPGGVGSPVA